MDDHAGCWTVRRGTLDDLGKWVLGETAPREFPLLADACVYANQMISKYFPGLDWPVGPSEEWVPAWG